MTPNIWDAASEAETEAAGDKVFTPAETEHARRYNDDLARICRDDRADFYGSRDQAVVDRDDQRRELAREGYGR